MSRSVGCSRFIFDRSIDRTQSLFSLNGAGSIKIDRMIGHSFCPILNLNGAGSVLYIESDKLDRLIGHSVLLR